MREECRKGWHACRSLTRVDMLDRLASSCGLPAQRHERVEAGVVHSTRGRVVVSRVRAPVKPGRTAGGKASMVLFYLACPNFHTHEQSFMGIAGFASWRGQRPLDTRRRPSQCRRRWRARAHACRRPFAGRPGRVAPTCPGPWSSFLRRHMSR